MSNFYKCHIPDIDNNLYERLRKSIRPW